MFLKIKQEGSENISKIKYENQTLHEAKAVITKKLKLNEGIELYYLDEEKDKVQLNDEDDWNICLESTADLSQSVLGSGVQNITLIVQIIPGSQPVQLTESPMIKQLLMSQNIQPLIQQPPIQQLVGDYTSSLFGGIQLDSQNNSSVHLNIVCDECHMSPLVGVRYKSASTNDYDLCEKCALNAKNRNQTFIRIPYYSEHENKTLYELNSFQQVTKIFNKNLKEPVSQETKALIKMLQTAFLSADQNTLKDLVKKNPGKSYNQLYSMHIKTFHS